MSFCGSRLSMRNIREILRLAHSVPKIGNRRIARAARVSPSTVSDVTLRFQASGLAWPLPEELSDDGLERALYASKRVGVATNKVTPDWNQVYRELQKRDITLALLWSEYKERNGDHGYEYSRYCELYSEWRGRLNLSMRQVHKYGEKCFVDFAGGTVPIADNRTGEILFNAQIFVGVLGASNYTFAEALPAQDVQSWIKGHVKMVEFFGGVPDIIVPDNLKAGVKSPDFYDPEINPTYQEWAQHYGVAVVPARIRKPKDKAKVEVAVQLVQRWILAALRNRTFYSLDELNEAIAELLDRLNRRPFKKMPGSREELFRSRERGELRALPSTPYDLGIWSRAVRVPFDYHVKADERLYSVPYRLADQKVEIRLSANLVEIFHSGQRVASHKRAYGVGPPITQPEHMPSHHRAYADWTPDRVTAWAAEIGEPVAEFCKQLMARKAHPEQGFRNCLGVIQLSKNHGTDALVNACKKAIRLRSFSYSTVKNLLTNNLQSRPESAVLNTPEPAHENVRGAAYYLN